MRFNRCVAHIYEFANALGDAIGEIERSPTSDLAWALREAGDILVRLFHPMMPHLAEECWAALGHKTLVATEAWPRSSQNCLVESTITLPVQINGKKRADVTIARDAEKSDIEAAVLGPRCGKKGLGGQKPEKGHCRPAKDRQCRGLRRRVLPGFSVLWRWPASPPAASSRSMPSTQPPPAALAFPDNSARSTLRRSMRPSGSRLARVSVGVRNELIYDLTGGSGGVSPTHRLDVKLTATQLQVIVDINTARPDVNNYGIDAHLYTDRISQPARSCR